MSKKNKSKKLQSKFAIIILTMIGMGCGLLGAMWIEKLEHIDDLSSILVFIGVCAPSIFLTMILHEAGHLVMGVSTGYGFVAFRIGSFMIAREDGKLVRRKFHIVGTGGQCILTHEVVDHPQDIPYFWLHFGGVFFNFLTALLCLLVILFASNRFVIIGFAVLAIVSVGAGMLNLVPTDAMGVGTDGYNLLQLKRSPVNRIVCYKTI